MVFPFLEIFTTQKWSCKSRVKSITLIIYFFMKSLFYLNIFFQSELSTLLIAFDHYLAIIFPLRYHPLLTRTR